MVYVIYHKETTVLVGKTEGYASERAAKAALTKMPSHKLSFLSKERFAIAERKHFFEKIEKTRIVTNLLSGKEVVIGVNTPRCCDPSTELYHQM